MANIYLDTIQMNLVSFGISIYSHIDNKQISFELLDGCTITIIERSFLPPLFFARSVPLALV
jgi:hypothetical protein